VVGPGDDMAHCHLLLQVQQGRVPGQLVHQRVVAAATAAGAGARAGGGGGGSGCGGAAGTISATQVAVVGVAGSTLQSGRQQQPGQVVVAFSSAITAAAAAAGAGATAGYGEH
jgi:hypothetical protein